ncbi:phosphatidylinositol N-acetylglucosaminyltransferase subunit gpi1 [Pleurotus ostreatus]|uniref:Phosphatidylinositol N-acetylglucosaminyltransferase subunit gpi1 n=1 Tax=Pleurotus ostreatus TaxID=5322 RepID=A0A8H6ZJZ7_PLEOS|nr:phosphatidylinositol N-acetylglucosaminyltransferase subunit gpi1 [Pleurotus ostreatus]KAF7416211.1 phosphatidylinositol N-acetylglucosaminyltransferase subunit gpi1 [Pleurotus ostreatus]
MDANCLGSDKTTDVGMLVDVAAGVVFGSYLCDHHKSLAQALDVLLKECAVEGVEWVLVWLNSWPAGLKLNTELSQFYVDIFMSILASYTLLLQRATPYTPALVYFTGILASARMSLALAFLADILALATAHLYTSYALARAIYAHMLATAASLWNLFRGNHYNVLRHRTDSWHYDIDQLLFGTIIFTLLAFLFPTVLVYYLLFAATRLATILAHAILQTLLALLTHSPTAVPAKPGDVYFQVRESADPHAHPQPYLASRSQPRDMASFAQYRPLWTRAAAHYDPARLAAAVLAGHHLARMGATAQSSRSTG